ncbi:DUF6497 family protein [Celeribacter sp.]|uniref:DUF6497 family protein n=1 Tax=Celeribacter sp. TaxID=1890673 RepID=UPI003A8E68CF
MRKTVIALSILASSAAAQAELSVAPDPSIAVPSGQPVEFYESLSDRPAMGLTARFRFLAPELPVRLQAMSYEDLEADLAYLCETYALPRLGDPEPSMIVISLASAPSEFGTPNPDVPEVFEMYRPESGTCAWEAF